MVCLIKPQFEAGKDKVGKKGVVREPEIHQEVIEKIIDYADSLGFDVLNLEFSPIKGPEGNIEYLVYIEKNPERVADTMEITEAEAEQKLKEIIEERSGLSKKDEMKKLISDTVAAAHQVL